jgi:hypothetical protein
MKSPPKMALPEGLMVTSQAPLQSPQESTLDMSLLLVEPSTKLCQLVPSNMVALLGETEPADEKSPAT